MRVNESRKRSLLKAVSFRIIEVAIDTAILSYFVSAPVAFGLSVGLEVLCLLSHYIFERLFNRINYGREVIK